MTKSTHVINSRLSHYKREGKTLIAIVKAMDNGIVHANSKDWNNIRETVCIISTRRVVV